MNLHPSGPPALQPAGFSWEAAYPDARLLIVDDEPANIALLVDVLSDAGYRDITTTTNSSEALPLYRRMNVPDLVLLDLMMPGLNGFDVMKLLQEADTGCCRPPVLVLTADISAETRRRALSTGARDFLTKPFDAIELVLRIGSLLENRFLHLGLQQQNLNLEERVQERTSQLRKAQEQVTLYAEELEEAHFETLERLAFAGEFRDDDTGRHTHRVALTTAMLAKELGFAEDRIRWIQQAARLHDVGKIGISDLILLKPGKLTGEEFDIMKTHTAIGSSLFRDARSDLIRIAQRIAEHHHERWDGQGYPQGLAGAAIPIEARLLSVADVFDALTHDRPYKSAWPVEAAVAEIRAQSGTQFDPEVVDAFMRLPHADLV